MIMVNYNKAVSSLMVLIMFLVKINQLTHSKRSNFMKIDYLGGLKCPKFENKKTH